MKNLGFSSASALFLLSLTTPQLAMAQDTARGSYRFVMEEDDAVKYVEFDAVADEKGFATGQMTLTDEATIPDVDPDAEEPEPRETPPGFYLKADIGGMVTEKNRAVMTGFVRDSSHTSYIGRWVQLVVEDNGLNNREVPDKLIWQACAPKPGGWIPSDSEVKDDDGAYLRWWATDAEVKDDIGIPSVDLLARDEGCTLHPLPVYTLLELRKWEGDIEVVSRR